MKFFVVLALPLFFAASCVHVHAHDDGYQSRGQNLESGKSCKERCKSDFHSCKSGKKGKGGASQCAHQKNACMKSC